MKRRMLSVLLALTMVLSLLPGLSFHVHAEGGNEASVTIDGVTTEYATLEEALQQVYFKTATIKLLQDVTVEKTISLFSNEDLLLCGNGHSITGADLAIDYPLIDVQAATLVLDNIQILNFPGNGTEIVRVNGKGNLTLQNDATVISHDAAAIVSLGTLTINAGTVGSFGQDTPAVCSQNGVLKLEAKDGDTINLHSSIEKCVEVMSGSLTMAGNLYVGCIGAVHSFDDEQVAAISLSGPLTGDPVPVYYDAFVQTDPIDFAMIAPAEGYTITAEDAAMIEPSDTEFASDLGADGWIWAKYTHVHQHLNGYTRLENEQHQFECACGETVTEDCEYDWRDYDGEHWSECIYCGRINDASREPHSPQENCLCECGAYVHQVESWSLSTETENEHTGYCTACKQTVAVGHDLAWGGDDHHHWTACAQDCGYKAAVVEHQWDDWLPNVGGFHYHNCGCGMTQEERHTDSDQDLICDICGDNMCVDANGDHVCDDCHYTMDELCEDADGNHRCDTAVCGERQEEWCIDADNDHICDVAVCGIQLRELCLDNNSDWLCDICEVDLCNHWLTDLVSNDDNTHTGVCDTCEREITEACDESYGVWWDETRHLQYCSCGRLYPEEPHNFTSLTSSTLATHALDCNDCGESILEEHRFVNGACQICEAEEPEMLYDVYVGGIGLEDGQYVDLTGNVSDTQPEDGYAYYEDGVLTLHNYVYNGDGILWKNDPQTEYTASIYTTVDLVLELSGDSSLTNTSELTNPQRDGIAAERDLTIRGDGSLTVLVDNDGIYLRNGDLVMEEGHVSLGVLEYDIYFEIVRDEELGDDGMDVDGDVIIEGGALTINSDDHGMDVNGNVIIRGGTVDVMADDDGLNVEEDIIIVGGDVSVVADDYGLDSDDGSVIIVGGDVYVRTNDQSGIYADENVEIYGGYLCVDAGETGIDGSHVIISGGTLDIYGNGDEIYCEELTLDVELPAGAEVDEYPDAVYVSAEWNLLIESEYVCIDKYPKDHKCDACDEEMGDAHEAADGKHTCNYCGEAVTQCTDEDPKDHECDVCGNILGQCADSDDDDTLCDVCGKDLFAVSVQENQILLENIPAGLKVILAGYNSGRMMAVQLVETVTGSISLDSDLLSCTEITVFFLNSSNAPVRELLIVK